LKKIGIINAGSGNISSVAQAFQLEGTISDILDKSPKIDDFDLIILPGVGSAGSVEKSINKYFRKWIIDRYEINRPILGICLGFQIMFNGTHESGGVEGLSLFDGTCEKLSNYEKINMRVGWHQTSGFRLIESHQNFYYFNHAYGVNYNNQKKMKHLEMGKVDNSISWIRKKNTFGCQFHPEKSQISGKYLIKCLIDKL